MPVIASDVDGCAAAFFEKVCEIYNSRYHPPISLQNFTAFKFEECFPEEIVKRILGIFNEPGFFLSLQPTPGAMETVNKLSQMAHFEWVTSPPLNVNPQAVAEKFQWLTQTFPHLSRNITVMINKFLIKADLFIDDSFTNIEKWCAAHPTAVGFLVNQPWNDSAKLPTNAVRGLYIQVPEFVERFFLPTNSFNLSELSSWKGN